MKQVSRRRQNGVSILGLMVVLALGGGLFVLGAKIVPTYIEYKGVERAAEKARSGRTPDEVRSMFDRAAQVDNITSVKGSDLDVTKNDQGEVVVRFGYDKEFSLGGPATLRIRYEGQAP